MTPSVPRTSSRSGLISWLYTRPTEATVNWIQQKYSGKPLVMEANLRAFKAGYHFGETAELFESSYEVRPASLEPGEYVNITGNTATAWGLIAAATQSGLQLFLGTYPITPASDILHELSKHKQFGVRTFQAEDEISGIGAALGAAFGGALGVTTTSGPGIDLKSETMGLAISLELPLLIIDIQRGGPSTGLPTKTEQADLLHAMYGRHGEAPLPIVAAKTPAHCFEATHGGGAPGGQVPDPGDPAVRRLPGQRDRAVAVARPGRAARHRPGIRRPSPTTPIRTAARSSGPTSGTPRPWPGRGRRRGWPAWSTGSVVSRSPTDRATWPTTAPTTSG